MKKQNNKPTKRLNIYACSVMLLLLILAGCNSLTDVEHAEELQSQKMLSETTTFSNSETANLKKKPRRPGLKNPIKEPIKKIIRVEVCHLNDEGDFSKITIAAAALEAHIAHGDGAVGDPYPEMTGFIFGDDCEPIFDGIF